MLQQLPPPDLPPPFENDFWTFFFFGGGKGGMVRDPIAAITTWALSSSSPLRRSLAGAWGTRRAAPARSTSRPRCRYSPDARRGPRLVSWNLLELRGATIRLLRKAPGRAKGAGGTAVPRVRLHRQRARQAERSPAAAARGCRARSRMRRTGRSGRPAAGGPAPHADCARAAVRPGNRPDAVPRALCIVKNWRRVALPTCTPCTTIGRRCAPCCFAGQTSSLPL